ncbi:MAG: RNA-directed DNA polymerase, partial [Bacteroidales bacterium]|nr:RNA-directed DNA polymerase [Bacteroidales bacterium]
MAMSTRRTTTTAQTAIQSAVSKHQEPEDPLLTDLFTAYYFARANKRNSWAQVKFERRLTDNLIELYDDIRQQRYKVGRSICFIIRDPVQREIFAASFRDRVVHHLVYNDLSPIFEPEFIDDSYSCRVGKGTLYGIERLERAMRECSADYTREAWVLKL